MPSAAVASLLEAQIAISNCDRNLVLLTKVLLLTLALSGLGTDLLVVLLEGGKVLTSLGELALLHALTDVPVDEGALGVPAGCRPRRGVRVSTDVYV